MESERFYFCSKSENWEKASTLHNWLCALRMFTFFHCAFHPELSFSVLSFEIRTWKKFKLSRDAGKFHYKITRAHVAHFSLASVSILYVLKKGERLQRFWLFFWIFCHIKCDLTSPKSYIIIEKNRSRNKWIFFPRLYSLHPPKRVE